LNLDHLWSLSYSHTDPKVSHGSSQEKCPVVKPFQERHSLLAVLQSTSDDEVNQIVLCIKSLGKAYYQARNYIN